MKFLVFLAVCGVWGGSDDFVGEVMEAIQKCNYFMEKSFNCWPPKRKIDKLRVKKFL